MAESTQSSMIDEKPSVVDFDKKYDIIDAHTPRNTLLSARYKKSFAYYTVRERLPIILTSIIDNLTQSKDEIAETYGENAREEVKTVVGNLSKLKYQLQTDKRFEKFSVNVADHETWNSFLVKLPRDMNSFFKSCWLYAECYMYRKIYSYFEATQLLRDYDYFAKQKQNSLLISLEAIEGVIKVTRNLEYSKDEFVKLLKLNLWGNRCDLSVTAGKDVRPNTNSYDQVNELNEKLLVNQTRQIWDCLTKASPEDRSSLDYVCDNAGYEFFTDLIVAEYMIEHKLVGKVRFHLKAMPWFISDMTPKDFRWIFEFFKEHSMPILRDFGRKMQLLVNQGKFVLMPIDHFWTSPYEFCQMKEVHFDLYTKLAESHLVIFKGDLNYRKLIGDFSWDFSEEFSTCVRGFQPTNICALRTIKSDLICDLKPGVANELNAKKSDWMYHGEYGVIHFLETERCHCFNASKKSEPSAVPALT